jgi:hypothetical protein
LMQVERSFSMYVQQVKKNWYAAVVGITKSKDLWSMPFKWP